MRSAICLGLCACVAVTACGSEEPGTGGTGGTAGSGTSGGTGGGGAPGVTGPITGSVTRYDYVFDGAALTADTKLTIDVAAPGGDCIDLESLVPPSGQVTWNGAPAVSAAVTDGVFHACGEPLGPGELVLQAPTVFPKKKYYGLDVGFSRKTNMAGGDFWYLLSWVGGCDSFGPCDDDPGALAEFHFDIHHAAGETVLCPGVITAGETSTQCDLEGTLAPTYSGVGWASDFMWQRSTLLTASGVDWVFYEVPGGNLAASLDVAQMTTFFDWITGLFGPFPYGKELRFGGGPTVWLGFEHPANIILYEGLANLATSYDDTMAHVTMHEITHQWAGDRVTIGSAPDFVWKEAMAEYIPYVFEDEQLGAAIGAKTRAYWDSISLQSQHFPRPTDDPMPHVSQFYGDVYGPGPMVLFVQLEALIGRAAVLVGIQSFLKEPGGKSVDELRSAIEAAAAKDLKPYFDAWVFGSGVPEWPTFAIETVDGGGGEITVNVTQENASGKLYPCVVEIEVQGATSSAIATIDFGLDPQNVLGSAKVMLAEPVVGVVLDPQHKLIAREKMSPLMAPKAQKVWIF